MLICIMNNLDINKKFTITVIDNFVEQASSEIQTAFNNTVELLKAQEYALHPLPNQLPHLLFDQQEDLLPMVSLEVRSNHYLKELKLTSMRLRKTHEYSLQQK